MARFFSACSQQCPSTLRFWNFEDNAERVISDTNYFPAQVRPLSQASDNWVVRFTALKRLYRLMTQYFADVLQMPTNSLEIPDLQAIAQEQNVNHTLIMCRLAISIGVQCERNKEFIERIQALNEIDQHHLMKAIERVRLFHGILFGSTGFYACLFEGHGQHYRHWLGKRCIRSYDRVSSFVRRCRYSFDPWNRDDHYYRIQSEKSVILSEKETLEKVYQSLLEERRTLQANLDDAVSEKEEALARLKEATREVGHAKSDKSDAALRGEVDRLRMEL